MGRTFPMPFRLIVDAKTAEVFAMGTAQRSKMVNVDQRLMWVQMCRDSRVSDVEQESGLTNTADINTKSFQNAPGKFYRQRGWLQCLVPINKFSSCYRD